MAGIGHGNGLGNGYTRFMVSASSARHVKNACKATALATLISLSYGWPVCLGRNCVVELGESLARIASGLLHNLGSSNSEDGPPFLGYSDHFGWGLKRPHSGFLVNFLE